MQIINLFIYGDFDITTLHSTWINEGNVISKFPNFNNERDIKKAEKCLLSVGCKKITPDEIIIGGNF